jgi:hypothetical protein
LRRGFRAVAMGMGLLLGAIGLDLVGTQLQSLYVLVLSFAMAIAGAIVALRGLVEFLGELV